MPLQPLFLHRCAYPLGRGDDYLTPSGGLIRAVHDAGIHDGALFDRHNAVPLQLLIEELEEFLHNSFINQLKAKAAYRTMVWRRTCEV